MMKKILPLIALTGCISLAQAENVVLDLSQPTTPIEYNDNDVWSGVYTDGDITSQGFVFSHDVPYAGFEYYEGFIVSRSSDNANHTPEWTTNQWGCMAQGGADEEGNTVAGKPYLINFYSSYSANTYGSSSIARSDNSSFKPEGCYVCNHPWTYYDCTVGEGTASPLEEGGYCKITFHGYLGGVETNTVDFYLASRQAVDINGDGLLDSNDDFTLSQWSWCDLTELGEVEVISITMESTDVGEYGMNTAAYVCIDGLQADCTAATHAAQRNADRIFAAGRQLFMQLQEAQHITLYNTAGATVWTASLSEGSHTLNLATLPAGIYIVRHNSGSTKVVL